MTSLATQKSVSSWWGDGWKEDYTVPYYHNFKSSSAVLVHPFQSVVEARLKQKAPKKLGAYLDDFNASIGFLPLAGKLSVGVDGKSRSKTGLTSTIGTGFEVGTLGADSRYPKLRANASTEVSGLFARPLSAFAHVGGVDTDSAQFRSGPEHARLGVSASHGSWVHQHQFQYGSRRGGAGAGIFDASAYALRDPYAKKDPAFWSFSNSAVTGYRGFALGAELVTSPDLGEVKDYNINTKYDRKGAFSLSIGTEDRLKNLIISPLVYLSGKDLAATAEISTPSNAPFQKITAWSSGLQWQLPRITSDTKITAKLDSESKVALGISNNDWSGARLSGMLSVPLNTEKREKHGLGFGFGAVFGDNHHEKDELSLDGSALSQSDGPCPSGGCPMRR
jgi:hypothetical protein